jgi:hypothetical protein
MTPQALQLAVIVAAGAVIVFVPLALILLASRIRDAAHASTQSAVSEAARHHERALAELTREHQRALGEYARQHERAMTELGAEHIRIAQEFGMFSQKRHQVYARLYARYRKATRDFGAALTGTDPEFQKFTRDDLLRYLKGRNIREKDASDAIAAMDRGDIFAMGKLMGKLHWRVTLRDANAAFDRAREFEALNELYMSDAVSEAVGNVRRKVEALSFALMREQERADPAKRAAKQDELQSSVASLLHTMRDDLRGGRDDLRPRKRLELDRTGERTALPRAALADKVPATNV